MSFTLEELEALMLGRATSDTAAAWHRSAPSSLMHSVNQRPAALAMAASGRPSGLYSPETSAANAAAVEDMRRSLPQLAPQPCNGSCEVCGENARLLPCTMVAGKPCRHMFCQGCLSQWIAAQVQARQRIIVCPAVDCGHALNQADIARLSIDPAVPEAHTALMAETYEARFAEMSADPELKAWMDANARPCPKCSLLITRATGCNAVACPCGHRFCYCCGQVRCVSNAPQQTGVNAFHALLAQQAELWREAQEQVDESPSPAAAAIAFASGNGVIPRKK
jgi:hypothetical protein